MANPRWINATDLPLQPDPYIPVSVTVNVKTDNKRVLTGYYDFDRGTWYVTGIMSGETVVKWTYLPK